MDDSSSSRFADYSAVASFKFRSVKQCLSFGVAVWEAEKCTLSLAEMDEDAFFSNLESYLLATNAGQAIFCEADLTNFDEERAATVLNKCNRVYKWDLPESVFDASNLKADINRLTGSNVSLIKFLDKTLACSACAGLLRFLALSSDDALRRKVKLEEVKNSDFMQLDSNALGALSIFPPHGDVNKKSSLFGIMDCTQTSMGSRLMRRWFSQPLQNMTEIRARQEIVQAFLDDSRMTWKVRDYLRTFPDFNRICGKFTRNQGSKATLKDMCFLYQCSWRVSSMASAFEIGCDCLKTRFGKPLNSLSKELVNFQKLVEATIDLDLIPAEYLISPLCSEKAVELREDLDVINLKMEKELKKVVRSLDLKHEEVKLEKKRKLGHVFKVNRKHDKLINRVKNHQVFETRKDGVRFTTRVLNELSSEFNEAFADYMHTTSEMTKKTLEVAGTYVDVFHDLSGLLAEIDVLSSFAHTATTARKSYCKPKIVAAGQGLMLKQARNPVVEENLDSVDCFIANDIDLQRSSTDARGGACLIVTGPNMSGKSTYIRTAGVATLLAHIGAYLPAEEGLVPLTDRILCRIGANDDHHKAASTFLVEMLETASILKSATRSSLVIIDELGRGTGSAGGFGLARAICNYLSRIVKASTMFATHFWELTKLENEIETVRNHHVTADLSAANKLTFKYEVRKGACEQSFGVYVAEMCHFPKSVVEVAQRKLGKFEGVKASTVENIKELMSGSAEDKLKALKIARKVRKQLVEAGAECKGRSQVHDGAILRGFPNDSSVEDAASTLARVIQHALNGDLAPEVLESARRALDVMREKPDIAALPGLLDTMYLGRNKFEYNALVLTTGSLRAMLALRSVITSPLHSARIIEVIAESCLCALRANDEKLRRIAKTYSRAGVQFTKAFDNASISFSQIDENAVPAATATALTFGVGARIGSDTATSLVPFFQAVLLRTPSVMWRKALAPDTISEHDAVAHTLSALYVARWVVGDDGNEQSAIWIQACRKASVPVLSALLDLLENHEQVLLVSGPNSPLPSYAALLSISIRDISLRFCDDAMLDELLCRVSKSSALVYCAASMSLIALCSNHPSETRIHQMVDRAYSLARACGSPHADERWKHLGNRLGLEGKSFTQTPSIFKQSSSGVKRDPMADVVNAATTPGADTMAWAEQLLLLGSQLRRLAN